MKTADGFISESLIINNEEMSSMIAHYYPVYLSDSDAMLKRSSLTRDTVPPILPPANSHIETGGES